MTENEALVADQDARKRRDDLIAEFHAIRDRFARSRAGAAMPEDEERKLKDRFAACRVEYFAALPRLTLGRCPFTGAAFKHSFDPWGFDGFWWQPTQQAKTAEPDPPDSFAVLQGAVSMNEGKPHGGVEEAQLGPAVPYVIPRILQLESMVAVISKVRMPSGYTAYPIAYFAEVVPPPGSLTQAWTERQYSFVTPGGEKAWTVKNDPWDFELQPWIERRKVRWIDPDDELMHVQSFPSRNCPFVGLPGVRKPQVVLGDKTWTKAAPTGEDPDPFD